MTGFLVCGVPEHFYGGEVDLGSLTLLYLVATPGNRMENRPFRRLSSF